MIALSAHGLAITHAFSKEFHRIFLSKNTFKFFISLSEQKKDKRKRKENEQTKSQ